MKIEAKITVKPWLKYAGIALFCMGLLNTQFGSWVIGLGVKVSV